MIRFSSLITILICSATTVGGQATPLVPPRDRVYRDIDRLAAAGLIDTLVVGVRPFSEREVLRLLGEARRNLDRNPPARAWAERVIGIDLQHYAHAARLIDAAAAEVIDLDSPYRGIPRTKTEWSMPRSIHSRQIGAAAVADGVATSLETIHIGDARIARCGNDQSSRDGVGDQRRRERIQRATTIGDGESAVRQSRDRGRPRLHDLWPIAVRRTFVFRQRADVGHRAHLARPSPRRCRGCFAFWGRLAPVYSSQILATRDRSIRERSSLDTTLRFCHIRDSSSVRKS